VQVANFSRDLKIATPFYTYVHTYASTYTTCNCIWQVSADNLAINSEYSRKFRFKLHFWDLTSTICNWIWQSCSDNLAINSEKFIFNSSQKLRFTFYFWDLPKKKLIGFYAYLWQNMCWHIWYLADKYL